MSKAIAKKGTNSAATTASSAYDTDCGAGSDILIPKILLMQGQSDMVLSGGAAFAEYRNSVTKEKLGDVSTPVKILPFFMFKNWIVSKKDGERWVFDTIEEYDPKVIHEWTEQRDGEFFKYEESINFYCLTEDSSLPIVVNFKSTSKRAGKSIYTQMYVINKSMGKLPFSTWFELTPVKETKNGNTYAKSSITLSGESSAAQQQNCKNWFGIIKKNNQDFKVDDSDHASSNAPAPVDTSDVSF
jgi:hypothetical protein